ncbi:GlxA family transcriptional regulator [Leisingera sp. ANG-Vp]|uniref:GlxA family transcriptional regulator n=1 Tax=Leisingera sp. ANG-Vp TaxID=1577896 RepID=UPI00057EAD6E|nr:GlxA family transcriptional regulator [Leisingera sp. ANG-Vp]KIC20180.1 hypothetical protein RA20_09930 [Leisingera sp. ANG-Vp]
MPSKKDKQPKTILFVVFPGVMLLDIAGALQVFTEANDAAEGSYELIVAAPGGGLISSDTVLPVLARPLEDCAGRCIDTLIVAGGEGAIPASKDPDFTSAIRHLSGLSRRTGSVCTGAFILAAAGLADGHRMVTHWKDCAALQEQYPQVSVEQDPVFIASGPVWSSAGVTAGIDMALAMVSEDCGRQVSLAVARTLVAYMVRPGGQSQFSAVLKTQTNGASGKFDQLHNWISDNLAAEIRVETLASFMNMSPRNFARVYTREIGQSPAKTVEVMRVDAVCRMLEETSLPVKSVAVQTGFGDEERMRRALHRHRHVSPSEYRQRFRTTG